jgi:hypothetical protein
MDGELGSVNGLKLPKSLVSLLKSDGWKRPTDTRRLAQILPIQRPEELSFLSLDGMVRETSAMVRLYEKGLGAIYGLTSSRSHDQPPHPELLDVDKAIIIAVNSDEDAIALDYKFDVHTPAVAVSSFGEGDKGSWRQVATDFATFVEAIALDVANERDL